MALLHNFTVTEVIIGCIVILLVTIATYYKWAFTYWNKCGLPTIGKPTFPFGNLSNLLPNRISVGDRFKCYYNQIKSNGVKHTGGYLCTRPQYMPIDPDYIKYILQNDFHHFTERGFYYNEKDDPLSANLFALGGEKWRTIRTKLSPAFTAGKLKMMFDNLVQCGNQMLDAVDLIYTNKKTIVMRDISESFTIDVIGSCAFGLDCNCFKHPDAEFKKQGRKIFYFNKFRLAKVILAFSYPKISRWFGLRLFDAESTRFFVNIVEETAKFRETHGVVRKDLLQLLLDLNNQEVNGGLEESGKSKRLTIEELTAQVFIFFAAGFETSSLTLAYCLYELAQNPNIQAKIRNEINAGLLEEGGKITYDGIMNMKYLDQVVAETLRKYPPVPFITRVCMEDYNVPGTNVLIEKGVDTVISIIGLHHDPEYYPDPDNFNPDRFSEENKRTRHPFTYIPFGEGPRLCIGLRFGLMQVKVGLVVLLRHYEYTLNSQTDVPLKMDPYSFTLLPESSIILDMERIS